jgi:hypothetical protein
MENALDTLRQKADVVVVRNNDGDLGHRDTPVSRAKPMAEPRAVPRK